LSFEEESRATASSIMIVAASHVLSINAGRAFPIMLLSRKTIKPSEKITSSSVKLGIC
jgi:hypothetical protein